MNLDFRNVNTLWTSIIAETLHRLGLKTAVICPGSRSAPLTIAFARHHAIEAIPILDERSAAFFALGIAKRTATPVALICTSGTAGANFFPAVIEARESRTPLLILTADRPPELRHCHAGQAIDQVKLYGNYPNWQAELALPAAQMEMLRYLRQTIVYAWERSHFPTPGIVHLNCPFREPLAPISQDTPLLPTIKEFDTFFNGILDKSPITYYLLPITSLWQPGTRGIIVAGVAQVADPEAYCQAIATLSQFLGYPVLAEALSPVRNFADLNPHLICTYDLIVRNQRLAEDLVPDVIIQLGELPTSKELRSWLEKIQPHHFIIDPSLENFDSLHNKTTHLRMTVNHLVELLNLKDKPSELIFQPSVFFKSWQEADKQARQSLNLVMKSIDFFLEGKIAWLLPQILPEDTSIFIANSMPVRDAEFFWMSNSKRIIPYFNRGANGIDGTLSTALGMAHNCQKNILITGDLAFLHDTNGLLINNQFRGHLTIVLINNNGGGIFEMLPIASFNPPFEDFFATPQHINFTKLCATYNIEHILIGDWQQLKYLLNPPPQSGIRVLEIQTDRKIDASWLKSNLPQLARNLLE